MSGRTGSDRMLEMRSALGLMRVKGIGSMRASRLVNAFGSARAVLDAPLNALVNSGVVNAEGAQAVRQSEPVSADDAAVQFFIQNKESVGTLLFADQGYPELLRRIAQPPVLLWTRGVEMPPMGPRVAMVGSRRATERGRALAWQWAYRLASAGITVVSGLAEGIDAAAHQGALDAGGHTVAVMGTGIDRIYPSVNRRLAKRVGKDGLLVTEFDPGSGPKAHHFPRRNRIIAGLCHMVVVVEAAKDSGSLITARMAQDEGREIGLVPGRPADTNAAGSNAAIRDNLGALVNGPEDILRMLEALPELDWTPPAHEAAAVAMAPHKRQDDAPRRKRRSPVRSGTAAAVIRDYMQQGPASMDGLLLDTRLNRAELERTLLDLLLDGRIRLGEDQRYRWLR